MKTNIVNLNERQKIETVVSDFKVTIRPLLKTRKIERPKMHAACNFDEIIDGSNKAVLSNAEMVTEVDNILAEASKGSKISLQSSTKVVRYLMSNLLLSNSQRQGAITNMTKEEFRKSILQESNGKI